MADVQVTCITKRPNHLDPHQHITHIGGTGGTGWRWTAEAVISSIEGGSNSFYTLVSGKRANLAVVDGPHGKYLRTHADGSWNDNLLALPECRV